jgi:glycerol uptake facilitator-like aquaporin
MTKLLRFIIETIGSFFIATSILIARRNVYHNFQLAVLYGGLLYSLNFQSQNKATFNFSLTIVNTIAGKYSFGDLIVALLAQILGTILGCVCGEFLHQGETSVIIAGGDTDITIYLTGAQFLMGFLFSFLLCIVSASASKELTTACKLRISCLFYIIPLP